MKKRRSWIANEIHYLNKKGFDNLHLVHRQLIWALKKYYMFQIKMICLCFILWNILFYFIIK